MNIWTSVHILHTCKRAHSFYFMLQVVIFYWNDTFTYALDVNNLTDRYVSVIKDWIRFRSLFKQLFVATHTRKSNKIVAFFDEAGYRQFFPYFGKSIRSDEIRLRKPLSLCRLRVQFRVILLFSRKFFKCFYVFKDSLS